MLYVLILLLLGWPVGKLYMRAGVGPRLAWLLGAATVWLLGSVVLSLWGV